MATLPPPNTKEFSKSSTEKKVYNIVNLFSEHLPITNDRNRLAFGLYKYLSGGGDPPEVLVPGSKLKIEGTTENELAKKIAEELKKITKAPEESTEEIT